MAFALAAPSLGLAVEPLELAGKEAAMKCKAAGVETFGDCANLQGKGEERSAARKAVIRALSLRSSFIQTCESRSTSQQCAHEADWLLASGLSSASN